MGTLSGFTASAVSPSANDSKIHKTDRSEMRHVDLTKKTEVDGEQWAQ